MAVKDDSSRAVSLTAMQKVLRMRSDGIALRIGWFFQIDNDWRFLPGSEWRFPLDANNVCVRRLFGALRILACITRRGAIWGCISARFAGHAVASGRKKGGLHLHPPLFTSSGNAGRFRALHPLKDRKRKVGCLQAPLEKCGLQDPILPKLRAFDSGCGSRRLFAGNACGETGQSRSISRSVSFSAPR